MRTVRSTRRPALAGLVLLTAPAALAAVAGCGIRPTSVPVDAGAAPSRVGCVLPDGRESSPEGGERNLPVRVYLVCGSRVSPVERHVSLPGGSDPARLPTARKLLAGLQAGPDAAARSAGFSTAVPRTLRVDGPHTDDPHGALRLSTSPDKLPSFALAQIVCTYADTATATSGSGSSSSSGRSVILGGPAHGAGTGKPLRRYECDTGLRTRPDAAATAGTRL